MINTQPYFTPVFTLSCNLSALHSVWAGICICGGVHVSECSFCCSLCNLRSLVGPLGLSGWLCGEIGREGASSPDTLACSAHLFIYFFSLYFPPLKARVYFLQNCTFDQNCCRGILENTHTRTHTQKPTFPLEQQPEQQSEPYRPMNRQ